MKRICTNSQIVKRENGTKKSLYERLKAVKKYKLTTTETLVYLLIASFDECYLSADEIANTLNLAKQTVKNAITNIRKKGLKISTVTN